MGRPWFAAVLMNVMKHGQAEGADPNSRMPDTFEDGPLSLLQTSVQRRPKLDTFRQSGIPSQLIDDLIHSKSETQPRHISLLKPSKEGGCRLGSSDDCHSVCQRLQLTIKDEEGGECPLFEWSLKTCGYSSPHPLDCAVELLRSTVNQTGMPTKVTELEGCLNGLSPTVNATCRVGIELVWNEISDWKKEHQLMTSVAAVKEKLIDACVQGQAAFTKKEGELEAMDQLVEALDAAEMLPGHYLADEIHAARGFLDKLSPIPPVKEALALVFDEGAQALTKKSLPGIKRVLTSLQFAIKDGEEAAIPVDKEKALLRELSQLEKDVLAFKAACFEGTVTLAMKKSPKDMRTSMKNIAAAVAIAQAAGVSDGLLSAGELVLKLNHTQVAWNELEASTKAALQTLDGDKKDLELLDTTISTLNASIQKADSMNISGKPVESKALEVEDRLVYVRHARYAIGNAIAAGNAVLANNKTQLNDNGEEATIQLLLPAIKWAQEANLVRRLEPARQLAIRLQEVEDAKEAMSRALAGGQASIDARVGEAAAMEDLVAASATMGRMEVTAGVEEATRQIDLLRARDVAKANMATAQDKAKEAWHLKGNMRPSIALLNMSITESASLNLTEEATMGQMQLDQILVDVQAERNFTRSVHNNTPFRRVNETESNDTKPLVVFNRTGYKVKFLPPSAVPGAEDDGDNDFQEHITAMQKAIADGKMKGFRYPDLEAQISHERNLENAYIRLMEAVAAGNASFTAKDNTDDAIGDLATGLSRANDASLELGTKTARALLKKLRAIQPARDQLDGAMQQVNVSLQTTAHLGNAMIQLNEAIAKCEDLQIKHRMEEAYAFRDRLNVVKSVSVQMKAAIVQGQIALSRTRGEEAAIKELRQAVDSARSAKLFRDLPVTLDLLAELEHMNAQHQMVEDVMAPGVQGDNQAKQGAPEVQSDEDGKSAKKGGEEEEESAKKK